MIKKILFLLLFIILLLVVLYNATVVYVEKNIRTNQYADIYDSCHKIWSARGFYKSYAEQNTLSSLKRAFSLGSEGAEIDLYYDVKTDINAISIPSPANKI